MATATPSASHEVRPLEYEANTFHDEQPLWLQNEAIYAATLMPSSTPVLSIQEPFSQGNEIWSLDVLSSANCGQHNVENSWLLNPLGPPDRFDQVVDVQLMELERSPIPRREISIQCQLPECAGREPFTQRSSYKRHMDRHEQPFMCIEPLCKNRAFPDKGTLQRHQQSVHGGPHIHCPVKSCKRHINGFARKDNLREHVKRAHPRELLAINANLQNNCYLTAGGAVGNIASRALVKDVRDGDCPIEEMAKATRDGSLEAQVLSVKLQELKAERARRLKGLDLDSLDEDIMAVERTLQLVSPAPAPT